jgi:hypothetical protein
LSQGSGGAGSPISTSPPTGDPIPQQVVNWTPYCSPLQDPAF